MRTLNDVHQQFAEYFDIPELKPYAWLLSKKLSEGHICLDLDHIRDNPDDLPPFCQNMPPGSRPLRSIPLVAKNGSDNQPFVLHQGRLYIQRYFRYETSVLERIQAFLASEPVYQDARTKILTKNKQLIKALFAQDPPSSPATASPTPPASAPTPDWQLAAAITGVLNNFTIITGGPGTGKTTTVARILAILFTTDPSLKVALAAPTGKAAARMAESLRNTSIPLQEDIRTRFQTLTPSTIHRLLRTKIDTPYFRYNAENPLQFDVVIIDECSMIDTALFAKLLDAIGPATRLILLGDKDQLASVEAGSLFGDLCQAQGALNRFTSERLTFINGFIDDKARHIPRDQATADTAHPLFQHVTELRHSHRFAGGDGIGKFSKAVIAGDIAALRDLLSGSVSPQVIVDPVYFGKDFAAFISGYTAFIREKDIKKSLQLLNSRRVLCAIREGDQGLYAVNRIIERYLHDAKHIQASGEFYENRPIILTRNYYEHGLFNGDTGIIRADDKGMLMAWFQDGSGELKAILPGFLADSESAWAMTIHKSQGSEFDEVTVVLPASPDIPILTRELLYTAITRAKKQVFIQGTPEIVLAAAQRRVERASGITHRFQDSK